MRAIARVGGLVLCLMALFLAASPVWAGDPSGARLTLEAPGKGWGGDPMTLTARLEDSNGKPIAGEKVEFLMEASFMEASLPGSHLISLGEATTNAQGVATFEFVPRSGGRERLFARYEGGSALLEAMVEVLIQVSGPLYQPHIGIRLPALGPELAMGPAQVRVDAAPGTVLGLRLPGGTISWLLLFVGLVATLWVTYLFVMYQVLRISLE